MDYCATENKSPYVVSSFFSGFAVLLRLSFFVVLLCVLRLLKGPVFSMCCLFPCEGAGFLCRFVVSFGILYKWEFVRLGLVLCSYQLAMYRKSIKLGPANLYN